MFSFVRNLLLCLAKRLYPFTFPLARETFCCSAYSCSWLVGWFLLSVHSLFLKYTWTELIFVRLMQGTSKPQAHCSVRSSSLLGRTLRVSPGNKPVRCGGYGGHPALLSSKSPIYCLWCLHLQHSQRFNISIVRAFLNSKVSLCSPDNSAKCYVKRKVINSSLQKAMYF